MTLTLFSLPKAFRPPYDQIQDNAIRSWLVLTPPPHVLLFGDEPGTAEAAARHHVHHVPSIARNALGTPLVDQLFRTATSLTTTPYQGYINADIILDPALPALLEKIHRTHPRALIVSRRWDLDINDSLHPPSGTSSNRSSQSSPTPSAGAAVTSFPGLAHRARTEGELYSHHGMDIFIFPCGLLDHMPPFSIGWPGAKYDNWMIYAARRLGVPVIDITAAITLIHQNHPTGSGSADPAKAQEHWINLDLLGGHGCCFDILDATHIVSPDGQIRRAPRTRELLRRDAFRLAQRVRYRLRRNLLGFRYANAH